MSLHNGLDTVAIVTIGIYSKTYGSTDGNNIANLFVSLGLFEDAPDYTLTVTMLLKILGSSFKKLIG